MRLFFLLFSGFLLFGLEPREALSPEHGPWWEADEAGDDSADTNTCDSDAVVTKVKGEAPSDESADPDDDLNELVC